MLLSPGQTASVQKGTHWKKCEQHNDDFYQALAVQAAWWPYSALTMTLLMVCLIIFLHHLDYFSFFEFIQHNNPVRDSIRLY